ncbi:hypothetical protein ACHAXS_013201 [Conticribra weissflogii]
MLIKPSFAAVSDSGLLVPTSWAYDHIRPHHLLVLYSGYHALSSLSSSRYLSKLQSHLSRHLTTLTSRLTDLCLPLVYSKFTWFLLPDFLLRYAIRIRCRHTLLELENEGVEGDMRKKMGIVRELKDMPIAIDTDLANEQHYEVPARFYDLCLGPNKKYSSGLWPDDVPFSKMSLAEQLEASEVAMLDLYCERAAVEDGMKIVDLGCGWGSLTLHLLKKYPNCEITSISNSHSQREYIINTATSRGLNVQNLRIVTCDVSKWDDETYAKEKLAGIENNDRVMSIEMFEHMKNYSVLLSKVHSFLKPNTGKLFLHIFTHKHHAYHFEKGWMADTFFTGGTMPSDDLMLYFGEHFSISNHWTVNGSNYEKTSNAWLWTMDENWKKGELEGVLEEAYGKGKGREWYVNWRLFYLACAELFGLSGGEEWIVSHYLFERRD